jgi:hypothetical protein
LPSATTSNCPPDPLMSVASTPNACLISAAKLAARGR